MENPFFVDRLRTFQDSTALILDGGVSVSYRELADRVDEGATRLGRQRHLLLLEARLSQESIAMYLASLKARCPIILATADQRASNEELAKTFDVERLISPDGAIHQICATDRSTALHPDLAVLLSTSGSTGSAKLVKLSRANLEANARSIATYLELIPDDVGALTLPLHYSYGLSVLNSHLYAGAAACLPPMPLTDPRIVDWLEKARCTNISGVPHSYEIFERIGLRDRPLATLRFMTAAGGRLPPDLVRTYSAHLQERGGRFFAMYGQTEASPRMAYLPPEAAYENPDTIGIAIPDGELLLVDGDGGRIEQPLTTGELVYRGPNVMMGYATNSADLGKGPELHELRTGDLAERTEAGYFRIVGRMSRFSKLSGFRVSHDDIERQLRLAGIDAVVTGNDERLVVALANGNDVDAASRRVMEVSNVKPTQMDVLRVPEMPRLSSGKVDYRSLNQLAHRHRQSQEEETVPPSTLESFRKAFWPRPVAPTDSFVSLGGDSLTFVQLAIDLEAVLDVLPRDWERIPINDLAAAHVLQRRWPSVDPNVYMRSAAILLVVLHHLTRWGFAGGASVLMCMVGYSLGRFQSKALFQGRIREVARPLISNALIYYGVLVGWLLWEGVFRWPDLLLLGNVLASPYEPVAYNAYWFVEAYVLIVSSVLLACSVPVLRARIAGAPFACGLGALAASTALVFLGRLTWGYSWNACSQTACMPTTDVAFWAAIGWCLYFAETRRRQILMSVAAVAYVSGLYYVLYGIVFNEGIAFFVIAVCALTWRIRLTMPPWLAAATSYVAANSYAIYLFHLVPFIVGRYYGFPRRIGGVGDELRAFVIGVGVSLILAFTVRHAGNTVRLGRARAAVSP
ncbi:MAG: AMP-binding protein [Vicinamibacterales bacterium]